MLNPRIQFELSDLCLILGLGSDISDFCSFLLCYINNHWAKCIINGKDEHISKPGKTKVVVIDRFREYEENGITHS